MEKILDRFLRYVSVDTQSNEESESQPSAAKEWDLLRMLRDELLAMGVEATLDEYGYVMASLPSNLDKEVPAVGFIAHVDTAPDASGKDVKPQIIENYDGLPIPLKGVPGLFLDLAVSDLGQPVGVQSPDHRQVLLGHQGPEPVVGVVSPLLQA